VWPKLGRVLHSGVQESAKYSNANQRVHVDFPNHTLLVPPPFDKPEVVSIIIYYSNVEETGGPTALVPREGEDDEAYSGWPNPLLQTPGTGDIPWYNDKEYAENYLKETRPEIWEFRQKLYQREVHSHFKVGTVLFYRHDLWHRGTPPFEGKLRLAHNIVFKAAASEWITCWETGWARSMYSPQLTLENLVAKATPQQRNCLAFPHPGHSYWTRPNIEAVRRRYGPLGMDMTPYEAALCEKEAP